MDTIFEVGERVSWTHVGGSGRTISMRLCEGTITEIAGSNAAIKPIGKGKPVVVALARLRKTGQQSQIGEFIEAMRDAHRHD